MKKLHIVGAFAASLLAGGLAGANPVTFETDSNTIPPLTDTLPGHECTGPDFLESVTITYSASASPSVIPPPGPNVAGWGIENTSNTAGTIQACRDLDDLSIGVTGGPAGSGDSASVPEVCFSDNLGPFDGTLDYGGTSGATSTTQVINEAFGDTVTYNDGQAGFSFFTSGAPVPVSFNFQSTGNCLFGTSDASCANGMDAEGSIEIAYTCKPPCEFNPNIPFDDPLCTFTPPRCTSKSFTSVPADNPLLAGSNVATSITVNTQGADTVTVKDSMSAGLSVGSIGSLPAGCSTIPADPTGLSSFDISCTGVAANTALTFNYTTTLTADLVDGSVSNSVNSVCGSVSGSDQLCGSTSGCTATITRVPPPPIPGITMYGLTAALIGLPMIGGLLIGFRRKS